MDIENVVESYNKRSLANTKTEVSKTLFVAPSPDELPDDGVLEYVTVETIFDLKTVPDRSVVLVREEQLEMIRCIAENSTVFDLKFATLTGLPGANYSVSFDEATWAFDKVAYAPFISELRVAGEIESQLEAQNRTVHDVEREKYTRKTGEVKAHTNFSLARSSDDITDFDTAEDTEFKL